MSVYEDILREQVKQGNMGGTKGPLGYLTQKENATKLTKSSSKPKEEGYHWIKIKLVHGIVYEATDGNGLSDPFVKFGRLNPTLFEGKYLFESPVEKKTLTPMWEWTSESKELQIAGKHRYLIVEMWDRDLLSRNDFIGGNTIDLTQFCKPERLGLGPITSNFTMYKDFDETTKTGKAAGEVELQFFVTFGPSKAFSSPLN
ncbi:C2 domain-containing protein [Cavenderia fasciculata]|uniref:C2 domain-containing protein n=1 Tax=Cavenderia fasciculata TaxID=261658 RepID=F4PRB0_CACFS|nr:C2 domain-containing protein [Cavenderia fasciculata]EGG21310.1 C2 domain-containing protein [Cavenderia fasciculata]|eukprot:XP_004359160.1 C2 domain-containing protein [Cavenderia fasciculata]